MIIIETTLIWLGMSYIAFGFVPRWMFPALLPVAPTAFTPMRTIHEMRGHRWATRWYTSGFL